MRSATKMFSASESPNSTQQQQSHGESRSVVSRYLLVATLLAVVYAMSSWTPVDTSVNSHQILAIIAACWIAGGGLTLGLLAFAAKKKQ